MKYILIISLSFIILSCSPRYSRFENRYQNEEMNARPDYSQLQYWAAHPLKKDLSDSIPGPLKKDYRPDPAIDVFFLYPTTLTNPGDKRWNATLNDPLLNSKTDFSSILYQASAFNEYRVFAPRYRQAHLRAYFTNDSNRAMAAFDTAYSDVRAAFRYYLKHWNKGHPIIIASHSQGSTHAIRLLKEFFDNRPLRRKLVAAYIPGMYVPKNDFHDIPVCSDSTQTGCICTWRTFRSGYIPEFVEEEKGSSMVVNPLTWNTNSTAAGYRFNKGGILRKFNRIRPAVAGARIHEGVIWTGRPRFPWSFLLRTRNYHVGDINLYYLSIRQNLRTRVSHYQSIHLAGKEEGPTGKKTHANDQL